MDNRIDDDMAEVLERLNNEAEADVSVFGSEAERLAAQSQSPRRRGDGQAVGSPIQQRFKGLTQKQQMFIEGIITGKTQRHAYRLAYPDDTSSDMVISTAASRLLKHPQVIKALEQAADETIDFMVDDPGATRRWVTKQLMISATISKQEGSRLKALELIGRAAGMFQQTQAVEPERLSAVQLKQELDRHLVMLTDVAPKRRHTGLVESTALAHGDADGPDPTVPPAPDIDAT